MKLILEMNEDALIFETVRADWPKNTRSHKVYADAFVHTYLKLPDVEGEMRDYFENRLR